MKTKKKRFLCILISLALVLGMMPGMSLTAFAYAGDSRAGFVDTTTKVAFTGKGMNSDLVTGLVKVYGGDEDKAREELDALYEAGIIDADGRMVSLDVCEDGKGVDLTTLSERIASGETVGELSVNGKSATPEQVTEISQMSSMLEIIRLMDEDVEVSDEHVKNLEALVSSIADGSVDVDQAIEKGYVSMAGLRGLKRLGNGEGGAQSSGFPETKISTGEVTTDSDGKYTGRMINGSTYTEDYSFTLADQTNNTYYVDSRYNGVESETGESGTGSSGTGESGTAEVTMAWDKNNYSNKGYISVTAKLSSEQNTDVSFKLKFITGTVGIDRITTSSSGNNLDFTDGLEVTWEKGQQGKKYFYIYPSSIDKDDPWVGSRSIVVCASGIKNGSFKDGNAGGVSKIWTKVIPIVSENTGGVLEVDESEKKIIENSAIDRYYKSNDNEYPQHLAVQFTNLPKNATKYRIHFEVPFAGVYKPINAYAYKELLTAEQTFEEHTRKPLLKNPVLEKDASGLSVDIAVDASYFDEDNNGRFGTVLFGAKADNVTVENVSITPYTPKNEGRITDVSVPAGKYYSGETVPVIVTLDSFFVGNESTKLTVNGVECPLLDSPENGNIINSKYQSRKFTFGYTVKEEDTGSLNVTALTGIVNTDGQSVTISDFSGKSIGAREQVSLVSEGLKKKTIDFTNAKYGISDDKPGGQVVTVMLPVTGQPTWIVNEAVKFSDDSVAMPIPGYENMMVDHYLAGAYFSVDRGATRYPVYVAEENGQIFLVGRFVPPVNTAKYLRKDTVNLFFSEEVLDANDTEMVTKCLPAWSKGKKSRGCVYFDGTGKADGLVVDGQSWSYYLKEVGAAFDKTEKTNRHDGSFDYNNLVENGFLKVVDGESTSYVKLVDADHPNDQYDVEIVADQEFYNALSTGVRAEKAEDITLRYQVSGRRNDFSFDSPEFFTWKSSDEKIATINTDADGVAHIVFTGNGEGKVSFELIVGNGPENDGYTLEVGPITVLPGKDPFFLIPKYSRNVTTLTGVDTNYLQRDICLYEFRLVKGIW